MTAGLFRNLSREAAARFSFLLAVPVMTAAGLAEVAKYAGESTGAVDTRALALGLAVSAVTGFACIHYFLKWLTRFGMLPYVIYRLALGAILFALVL
jgi:undecaprenyl-diphosphatase